MGSSFPRHGAKERTRHTKKNQKEQKEKTKGKLQVSTKKKKIEIAIYMMHEQKKCHDACSNAVITSSI